MQIFYVIDELNNRYPSGLKEYMQKKIQKETDEDYFLKPNNLREITTVEHLLPFLMHYLKDMKNESIDLVLHPMAAKFLEGLDVDPEDLSVLNDEDLLKFKEIFMSTCPKLLKEKGQYMNTLLEDLLDIASKRVPTENINVKAETVQHKVRFVPLPEGIIEEPYEEKFQMPGVDGGEATNEVKKHKANVKFSSVLLLKVQQREEEEEVPIE